MKHPKVIALSLVLLLPAFSFAPCAPAHAEVAPGVAEEAATAPALLAAADALIDANALTQAAAVYQRVLDEHPQAPEAGEARRALKILAAQVRASAPPQSALPPLRKADDDVILRVDPYSAHTSERLRLTTWEKLDFGVTSFLYGMSVGVSYAVSMEDPDAFGAPIALGALGYTLGAIGFLKLANPDRGDLPLALGITSYLPTTTLLVSSLLFPDADGKTTALATATAGLVAVPVAILAASRFNLDPGDTQLVRDAGFWGLTLSTLAALGYAGKTMDFGGGGSFYQEPESPTIARFGLLGLYGGLGLGVVGASISEVSLERVRVATWGGYGGGLLGVLLGSSADDEDLGITRGAAVGALLGLVATFLATEGLDGIPPEQSLVSKLPRGLAPAVLWGHSPSGASQTTWGIQGNL